MTLKQVYELIGSYVHAGLGDKPVQDDTGNGVVSMSILTGEQDCVVIRFETDVVAD